MSPKLQFAAAVCVSGLVGLAMGGALRWSGQSASSPAILLSPNPDAELAETLLQAEHEIARLRAEVQRLEALLEQPREVAALPASGTGALEAESETAAKPSALSEDTVESARQLLGRLLPERFGALSKEEVAALTTLDLHGSKATDADLAILAGLPGLNRVSLRGTAVSDAGIAVLANVPRLTAIDLRATQISGVGLATLPLYRLDELILTDTKVTGDDLRWMPPMADLRVFKLNRLQVGDDALRKLPYMPALKHLELDGTSITAAGLRDALRANPSLTRIELRGTAIDQDSLGSLNAEFPGVEFVADTPGAHLAGLGR